MSGIYGRRYEVMPINGLSDRRRLPRLGKLHLGVKVQGQRKSDYPRPTDYFVCPKVVQDVYGEKPKVLDILFPVESEDSVASQYYRCYSQTRGLICRGDGVVASALVDTETGEIATSTSKQTRLDEVPCCPDECPQYQKKQCRPLMCLQFLLPRVPGLGVWQIDTSSINSILNVNSSLELIRRVFGRISMVPLQLKLVPQDVQAEGKKKKVHVLSLDIQHTLADVARNMPALALPAYEEAAIPVPDDEVPTDQYPEAAPKASEAPERQSQAKAQTAISGEAASDRQISAIKQLFANMHWTEQAQKVWLRDNYEVDSPEKLTKEQASDAITTLNRHARYGASEEGTRGADEQGTPSG